MTNADELAFYFKLASGLSAARRSGNYRRIDQAEDELEVFLMYAQSPILAARAHAALANLAA